MSRPPAGSTRRSTGPRRWAPIRCRCSRRARGPGGRRTTLRRTSSSSRSGARKSGSAACLCHALYLVNLASPKDDFYEKSVTAMCNTMDVGCAIEAEGVVFHIGSHLGAGMEAGLERVVEAMKQVLDRSSETTWLLMENSAGSGDTIGRSIEELALDLRAVEPAPAARRLPRFVSPVRVRLRRDRRGGAGRRARRGRPRDRSRPAPRAARERLEDAAGLERRSPRQRRRGPDRREARRLPGESEAAGAAGGAGGPGPGRPWPRRGRRWRRRRSSTPAGPQRSSPKPTRLAGVRPRASLRFQPNEEIRACL